MYQTFHPNFMTNKNWGDEQFTLWARQWLPGLSILVVVPAGGAHESRLHLEPDSEENKFRFMNYGPPYHPFMMDFSSLLWDLFKQIWDSSSWIYQTSQTFKSLSFTQFSIFGASSQRGHYTLYVNLCHLMVLVSWADIVKPIFGSSWLHSGTCAMEHWTIGRPLASNRVNEQHLGGERTSGHDRHLDCVLGSCPS